jgi:hypothetical protein
MWGVVARHAGSEGEQWGWARTASQGLGRGHFHRPRQPRLQRRHCSIGGLQQGMGRGRAELAPRLQKGAPALGLKQAVASQQQAAVGSSSMR